MREKTLKFFSTVLPAPSLYLHQTVSIFIKLSIKTDGLMHINYCDIFAQSAPSASHPFIAAEFWKILLFCHSLTLSFSNRIILWLTALTNRRLAFHHTTDAATYVDVA